MFGWLTNKRRPAERTEPSLGDIVPTAPQASWSLSEAVAGSELYDLLSAGAATYAGPSVTPDTAMRVSAVYACVRLIAGAIASLPFPVYAGSGEQRERSPNHPTHWLLNDEPTPLMSAPVFWEMVAAHVLLHGDAFSLIVRDRAGRPLELLPVPPTHVAVERKDGRLRYYIDLDGEYIGADQDDVLHIPGIGFDGKRSMSPIRWAAKQAAGLALAAEEYSARFFGQGFGSRVVLNFKGNLSTEQRDSIRQQLAKLYGGLDNAHRALVIGGAESVTSLTMDAQDALLIESRRFQVVDIARVYGVPPHMIGETEKSTSWGSGIEQQNIGFVTYTLRPHLARIEAEINRKLFRTARKFFAEWNVSGLLRGDAKSRADYYTAALGGTQNPGWMTPNEVRRLENLPPVDGGNALYRPADPGAKSSDDNEESPAPTGA